MAARRTGAAMEADLSLLHSASRRAAAFPERSAAHLLQSHHQQSQRQTHEAEATRHSVGNTATEAHVGNGHAMESYALRQCDEYRSTLSQRMAQAEEAAKAMRNAKQTVHAETMLAQAKAEAEVAAQPPSPHKALANRGT
jgi:hypothetical protein